MAVMEGSELRGAKQDGLRRGWPPPEPDDTLPVMTGSTDGGGISAEHRALMDRLGADREWLAGHDIQLSQFGPDPVSGKVRVYLAHFTEFGRDLLIGRYGSAIVVDTQSTEWRFTGPRSEGVF
jgi:hypothetical protein